MRHRPIGIGVQGLADAFILMRYPFESEEAQKLNKDIFETIYYDAVKTSCELAKEQGPYETFKGSPMSKGVSFQILNHLLVNLCLYNKIVHFLSTFLLFGFRSCSLTCGM